MTFLNEHKPKEQRVQPSVALAANRAAIRRVVEARLR